MTDDDRARLQHSAVATASDSLVLVHHATQDDFAIPDMAPFSHFGTRSAAKARVQDDPDARLISAFLDIRAPLEIADFNDVHDPVRMAGLVDARMSEHPAIKPGIEALAEASDETALWEDLADALRLRGYDGLCYRNHHEDPGSMSWIVLSPRQVVPVFDGLCCESRDAWELSLDTFTGPSIVAPVFGIDGGEPEFSYLREALDVEADDLLVLARDDEGWDIRWLDDWEPAGTMGLFSPAGEVRGFYTGGMAWIDPDARGAGRSTMMILAAAEILGGSPAQNDKGMGFTDAGHAAHAAAWHAARERAVELGYDLGEDDDPTP